MVARKTTGQVRYHFPAARLVPCNGKWAKAATVFTGELIRWGPERVCVFGRATTTDTFIAASAIARRRARAGPMFPGDGSATRSHLFCRTIFFMAEFQAAMIAIPPGRAAVVVILWSAARAFGYQLPERSRDLPPGI